MFCHVFVTSSVYIISIMLASGPGIRGIYIYFLIAILFISSISTA